MIQKFKYIFSILIILLFASCEDPIQIKLDKGDPILTVDAFVNDLRSPQKIRLTETDDYFSQTTNKPVVGASIKVRDLTSGLDYIFNDNGDGNYLYTPIAGDTMGRVGHQYELEVSYKGDVFKSNSRMNRTTKVDSIITEFKEGGGLGNTKPGYDLAFLGFDLPGDTVDYYWIKSYRNNVFFNKGIDINVAADGAYGYGADGFPFITPIAESITPFGERFQKFDTSRVEIHSINLTTYNFLNQIVTQTTNTGLFATTPENIKCNIYNASGTKTKVLGWFCMSAVGYKELVVQ